jgi:hypothetical protein
MESDIKVAMVRIRANISIDVYEIASMTSNGGNDNKKGHESLHALGVGGGERYMQ